MQLALSELSKNQENDMSGAKKCLFLGVPLGTIWMGFLGHIMPSLTKDLVLREEIKFPKKPIEMAPRGTPPKKAFFAPKNVIVLIFSNFDLKNRGTLGSQPY